MTVFTHHIYEYKKGLRNLVLHTMPGDKLAHVRRKLERSGIDYETYRLERGNVNVFFGSRECVEIVRAIGKPCLNDYTPEEDFMLGTMLGYDRLLQCRRYLGLLDNDEESTPPRGRLDLETEMQKESLPAGEKGSCAHDGDGTCTGCITGNPCPECKEKMVLEIGKV